MAGKNVKYVEPKGYFPSDVLKKMQKEIEADKKATKKVVRTPKK